jgi:hypothetical protein
MDSPAMAAVTDEQLGGTALSASDIIMTQDQQPQPPGKDSYSQRGKILTSSVQRLRGWVGSDPSRAPELADSLVLLTSHRLLGHAYAAAAADAREALRRAAELLTANGPIGPYTSVSDTIRYLTALVHLAVVQTGLGLPEVAGRTIESLEPQLRENGLETRLQRQTAIWALLCAARAALASQNIAAANAYADAALAGLSESGLRSDPDYAYLAIDVDRLASDCRWAAGKDEDALSHLYAAKARYEDVVGRRLSEPGRQSPALVERLAEPLFSLYRDIADRLIASGEVDLGLATRRTLIERLRGLTGPLGDPARVQLGSSLTDLAADLLGVDRLDEADAAAAEAALTVTDPSGARGAQQLLSAVRANVLTRRGRSAEALAIVRQALPADVPDSASAADAVVLLARVEALRAHGDLHAAEVAEQAFGDLALNLVGANIEPTERLRLAVRYLARGVVSRGTRSLSWAPLPPSASYAATIASAIGSNVVAIGALEAERRHEMVTWREAERATAHRLELDRLQRARAETERREAERVESERAAAEQRARERALAEQAARVEAERRAAAEEADRLERKRRRQERLDAHRHEVERREAEQREAERIEAETRLPDHLATDSTEAERLELERLQAELDELEREEERPS